MSPKETAFAGPIGKRRGITEAADVSFGGCARRYTAIVLYTRSMGTKKRRTSKPKSATDERLASPEALGAEAAFLSWGFAVCAIAALTWFLLALRCAYTFAPVTFPIFGLLAPSEAMVHALTFGALIFIAAHAFLHRHQRVMGGQFPAHLTAKTEVPKVPPIYRTLVFLALVMAPTIAYAWIAGRAFSHLEIVLKGAGQNHVRQGLRLLAWPDASEPPLTNADWRWSYWADAKAKQPPPLTTALPSLQPAWFLLCTVGFGASGLIAWRHRPRTLKAGAAATSIEPS